MNLFPIFGRVIKLSHFYFITNQHHNMINRKDYIQQRNANKFNYLIIYDYFVIRVNQYNTPNTKFDEWKMLTGRPRKIKMLDYQSFIEHFDYWITVNSYSIPHLMISVVNYFDEHFQINYIINREGKIIRYI